MRVPFLFVCFLSFFICLFPAVKRFSHLVQESEAASKMLADLLAYPCVLAIRKAGMMNSCRCLLSEFRSPSFVPLHEACPSWMKRMFSPIPKTEFISCVLTIVVIPSSWVMERINSSMMSDDTGSSPELGSSQKR